MKKVLIIDDEQRILDIYLKLFFSAGFVVFCANDAQAATNILIREDIDIILLDLKMPMINGRTMFEIIEEYNPKAKVIISSVYSIDKQKELVPGALDYYDKSEGPTNLLTKVQHALGQ